jgi:acyl-homoserine lactone acylase PvdQ
VKNGQLKDNDWERYVDPNLKPQILNPKKGYIANANNKFATNNVEGHVTAPVLTTVRSMRLKQLIEEELKISSKKK